MPRRKPTRRDLLRVIGRLQDIVGSVVAQNHDRNPNRVAQVTGGLMCAHRLCIEALAFDPSEAGEARKGDPWADNTADLDWLEDV
jgi:hypothetical protein